MKKLLAVSLLTLCVAMPAVAQVKVDDPWVRATVPQQRATGAFMQLTAPVDARLVEVQSPAAAVVEIHEMTMDNDVMRMRAIESLDLPAGQTVELKPGGYHVMLIDLKAQAKEGDTIPVTLIVENKDGQRETIEIAAPVRPLNPAQMKHRHGHGH
ncbi:MAG TPA: copper chaperone PCu(A)C [Rhodocyclaceae bacterium]|nr:copper chaperone PCu(A)C [Rhodocyclaceae bacterium]HRQ46297.1 copper chaperone PCu(A)C [Rhodocyclaceae bacterium]